MLFKENDIFERDFELSSDLYQGFLALFKDKNRLHTDHDFAVSKGFRSKVMHGNILNGFLSFLIGECLPIDNVIIHSQEIQYKQAVYLDDILHCKATVAGVYESVNAVEFKFQFTNDSSVVVAKGKFQIGILL